MNTERPHSRARNVALFGLAWQLTLAAGFAILTTWTQSEALRSLALLSGCGIPIWLYLVLVYHQRILVQEEGMETEELRRARERGVAGEAIFDQENLLLAQRRLTWMYRWLLPIFTVLVVTLLCVAGLVLFPWHLGASVRLGNWPQIEPQKATLAIWFIGSAALLTFWTSRFASGLGRYPEWRMLRSGASWLMGIVLGAVAAAATFAPLHWYADMFVPERVVAYVLRILLLVLAAETLFNFVLDFYRPRTPGEEPRPAFDSRLLGLFSQPGGITRSIAEAMNYQFGFEVSSTWLYKLLERAALPLAGFAVLVLFAASSFVIVQADQEAVVERFGKPLDQVLDPGLHVKLPWPMDIAYKVSTKQIHEFKLGDVEAGSKTKDTKKNQLILWTGEHEEEPHVKVLIATPQLAEFMMQSPSSRPAASAAAKASPSHPVAKSVADSTKNKALFLGETGAAVSVSMLRVALTIQYEIEDARDWISRYKDPEAMLKAIASHELTQACASQTVEAMLSEGQAQVENLLRQRIGQGVKNAKLGIRIRFLGLQGVHPPEQTAEAFQDVIGAEQKAESSRASAQAESNTRLSKVAGDVERAEALAFAIQEMNRLESDPKASEQTRQAARDQVHTLFFGNSKEGVSPVGGEAAGIVTKARALRWTLENEAHAQATMFAEARALKNAAPKVFYLREKLNALAVGMQGIRKFVLAGRGKVKVGTLNLNLQDPANAALDFSGSEK